jgi:nicotinamidase-related amidase
MASIRGGGKSALIVVDTQVGVLNRAWDTHRVVGNVARAVERARAQGIPVIWVQHADQQLLHGSADWQLVPDLVPRAGEAIVEKQFESSFENTSLEPTLAELGVSHVVLAGAMTNWCIRATAYGALDRGYDLTLVKDAHTTATVEFDNGLKIEAEKIVQELNVVLRWITYPGRSSGTATAEEVGFSPV